MARLVSAAFLAFSLLLEGGHCGLVNVTDSVFGQIGRGSLAAFGDFNSDKQTDAFIVTDKKNVTILLSGGKKTYFSKYLSFAATDDGIVTSVVPGDYDGDSQMDVLVATTLDNVFQQLTVYWGNQGKTENHTKLEQLFKDEPLVLDFDGDMIPDVLGEIKGEEKSSICFLKNRLVNCVDALQSSGRFASPHSHAFLDLNRDFTADLFLTNQDGHQVKYDMWYNVNGNFTYGQSLPPPADLKVIGQSAFADFDGDGGQDHLLPGCTDSECHTSVIYLNKPGSQVWTNVSGSFRNRDVEWRFKGMKANESPTGFGLPITLHMGDYNMDGFPDVLVILVNSSDSSRTAFLLENVPCTEPSCSAAGRMLQPLWDLPELTRLPNALVATFFDLYEDGILDVLVMGGDLSLYALHNSFESDAYFVKVIVLSGLCFSSCPTHTQPFGVNQPGPYVQYTSVDANGYQKNASAGQLSQSAHLSLQLPYAVLGLGRSANFIDRLAVGIPRPPGQQERRRQEWTSIIPNSQLIVIPFPNDKPRSWSTKLYLTPSQGLLTGIALLCICIAILIIIGILHWNEKKADDKEKRLEAHRFHFDAM
ncbi:T-cell immunomodulatory protein [Lethenteron reissneri]|uniref:T-cell immunomodulatory protein n=1 Tax=Lethenteron reissneri TaxID=7753 RepID=UPI002AB67FD3|nr:T-cell immunomodulatory protein [Lethenteron reissneri]